MEDAPAPISDFQLFRDSINIATFAYNVTVVGLQVKLAIIGVRAGGVGLDFSAAQSVAFVELPKSASEMLQVLAPSFNLNVLTSLDNIPRSFCIGNH